MKTFNFARIQNSTIVPFMKEVKAVVRKIWDYKDEKPQLLACLNSGHAFSFPVLDRTVKAWSWGDGPTVFFVPDPAFGPAAIEPFLKPLVDAGYSVITFQPGPQFGATAIKTLVEALGPAHAVLAKGRGEQLVDRAVSRGMKVGKRFQVGNGSKDEVLTLIGSLER